MKIALIGAQRTGKTTLAEDLSKKLYLHGINVGLLAEVARDCPLPLDKGITPFTQKWIMHTQCAREIELKEKYDLLICDRSVLDAYAYHYNKFGKDKLMSNIVKEYIKTYDLLFKLSTNKNYLIDDGFAETDPIYQKDIDKSFDFLLKKLNIDYQEHENLNKTLNLIYNKWNDL